MKNSKTVKPFGFKDKLGYLCGDLGNDFAFMFSSMYLMLFYTKVWGVSASLVGTLFLLSRVLDAFTDITMGTIVDKMKPTKDGKFRPWLKRMSGPLAIMTFLMFQSGLADASMTVKTVVMFSTYILWGSICYTAINIPYGSMASAITEVPEERAALSTWRSMGASIASLIIGSLAPQFIYYADANGNQLVSPERFTMIAGIFSVCAFVFYMICFFLTTERVKFEDNNDKEKVSVIKNLGIILKNKALLAIVASSIVLLLSQLMMGTMNQYLYADYFRNINALSVSNMAGLPISFLIAAVIVKIAAKFGKKEICIAGMLFAGILYCVLFLLKVTNPWIFVGVGVISLLGTTSFNMLMWANITDIIDYQEVLTGKRDDGTIYAVYSFSRKIGQALAGGLGGYALSWIGYNSMAATQTTEVTSAIYSIATGFPAVAYILVAVILIFAYPLSKKVVNENASKLAEIRAKKAV